MEYAYLVNTWVIDAASKKEECDRQRQEKRHQTNIQAQGAPATRLVVSKQARDEQTSQISCSLATASATDQHDRSVDWCTYKKKKNVKMPHRESIICSPWAPLSGITPPEDRTI